MSKELENYYEACEKLAEVFIQKYFGDDASYHYWIGDQEGGTLVVNDYYFSMENVVAIMEIEPSWERISDAYYYLLDCAVQEVPPKINFENYLKYGKLEEGND